MEGEVPIEIFVGIFVEDVPLKPEPITNINNIDPSAAHSNVLLSAFQSIHAVDCAVGWHPS